MISLVLANAAPGESGYGNFSAKTGQCPATNTVHLLCPYAKPTPSADVVMREGNQLLNSSCTNHAIEGVHTVGDMRLALLKAVEPAGRRFEGFAPDFELERWTQLPKEAHLQPKSICEIGLNKGTSAAAWLCSFPDATFLSFDMLRYSISVAASRWLRTAFPGRFDIVKGDTTQSLWKNPRLENTTCDVVSIDGGHTVRIASNDLKGMKELASPKHVLLMDDLRCAAKYCRDPTRAWMNAQDSGLVFEEGCQVLNWDRGAPGHLSAVNATANSVNATANSVNNLSSAANTPVGLT
ncbi:hypothetical protein AB1Y20_015359 [Prymnesium parvum]|uniref:Uncharacterized protein n=1 Tax=Prymnesium parvum TaxID=97485 RepID=A0AB34JY90_PRYPA